LDSPNKIPENFSDLTQEVVRWLMKRIFHESLCNAVFILWAGGIRYIWVVEVKGGAEGTEGTKGLSKKMGSRRYRRYIRVVEGNGESRRYIRYIGS
jgi:hypothetical protein